LKTVIPDLILLDIVMPVMDGFTMMKNLKLTAGIKDIPVIFLTFQSEPQYMNKGFDLGAVDYIFKPFNSKELLARVRIHVENSQLRNNLEKQVEERSKEIIEMHKELVATHQEMMFRLGRAAEFRDNETGDHIRRIGLYAKCLAVALDLPPTRVSQLEVASMMHDVGKIGIPDHILLKPGKLSQAEFEQMKQHTIIGYELLSNIDSELISKAAEVAICHHEKWDGSGYPYGLSGEAIPISGRIVAVADVFDALTSARPYKEAWSSEDAVDLIREQRGKHFDPCIVDIFMNHMGEIMEIKEMYEDNSHTK